MLWLLRCGAGLLCQGGGCCSSPTLTAPLANTHYPHPTRLQVLPQDIREPLVRHPKRANLLEVVLDLGRRPEARFLGEAGGQSLREGEVRV